MSSSYTHKEGVPAHADTPCFGICHHCLEDLDDKSSSFLDLMYCKIILQTNMISATAAIISKIIKRICLIVCVGHTIDALDDHIHHNDSQAKGSPVSSGGACSFNNDRWLCKALYAPQSHFKYFNLLTAIQRDYKYAYIHC